MSRVRHAGYLVKEDSGLFEKHWCVVRDRAFIVYPFHENAEEFPLSIDTTPIHILPISHLSATAYALPAITKRTPTKYSLELKCAATGRELTFYANQSEALERWVDAIKMESSLDYVTPQDSPQGALLPPEIGSSLSTTPINPVKKPIFASRFGKETLFTKYLEHIKNNEKNENVFPEQSILQSTSISPSSQFPSRKDVLSLSDVMSTAYDGDISGSLTPLSSPAPSTPPDTRHSIYQDSADPSSISSSTTSSPVAESPRNVLRSSFARQQPLTSKREKRQQTTSSKNPKAAPKGTLKPQSSPTFRDNLLDKSTSSTSAVETDMKSSYFYTGKREKNKEKFPLDKEDLKKNAAPKRHTIGELMQNENLKMKELQKKSKFGKKSAECETKSPSSRAARHSIAPLSSLDMQISQRRGNNSRLQLASQQLISGPKPQVSDSESEESLDREELQTESIPPCEQPTALHVREPTDANNQSRSQSRDQTKSFSDHVVVAPSNVTDTTPRPSTMEIQSTLSLARVMMEKTRFDDSRRRSGNFGSRVINRVSSVVAKRPKISEDTMTSVSTPTSEKSVSENLTVTKSPSDEGRNFPSDAPATSDAHDDARGAPAVVTQGWLSKRKRMKWTKYWAVLSSDKKLTFYHDEASQATNASSIVDLQGGCSVESVAQAKSSNHFTLVPLATMNGWQSTQTLKSSGSNPLPSGKRIHLMCKSTQEFVHWMKSFVVLNSSSSSEMLSKMVPQRTLNPIKPDDSIIEQINTSSPGNDAAKPKHPSQFELNNNCRTNPGVNHSRELRGIQHSSSLQNVLSPLDGNEKKFQIQKSSSFSVARKPSPLLCDSENRTSQSGSSNAIHVLPCEKQNDYIHEEAIRPVRANGQSARFVLYDDSNLFHNDRSKLHKSTSESLKNATSVSQLLKGEKMSPNVHTNFSAPQSSVTSASNPSTFIYHKDGSQTSTDQHLSQIKGSICDYLKSESGGGREADQYLLTTNIAVQKSITDNNEAIVEGLDTNCAHKEVINILQSHGESTKSRWCDNARDDCRHNGNQANLTASGNSKEKLHDSLDHAALLPSKVGQQSSGKSRNEIESAISFLPFSLGTVGQNSASSGYTSISGSCVSLGKQSNQLADELEYSDSEDILKVLEHTALLQSYTAAPNTSGVPKTEHQPQAKSAEIKPGKNSTELSSPAWIKPSVNSLNHRISAEDRSSKFIITQTDLLHIADNSKPLVTTECVCQTVPTDNDQIAFFLTPKVSNLRRSNSDSNILEPTNGKTYRMRTIRKPVPILTHIDFLEVYGPTIKRNAIEGKFKSCISLPSNLNEMRYEKRLHGVESGLFSSQYKPYNEASSTGSSSSIRDGSTCSRDFQGRSSRKSSESGTSHSSTKSENRKKWLGGITAYKIGRGFHKYGDKKATSKPQIFEIAASSLTAASHCGYLDRKNKKKQWERFWCVLQDSCLYCYNTPQSDVTRDVILLRGYAIIADVMNLNRTRFEFRLEQQGSPTLCFSTDNHQEFLLWVGSLEREFRKIPSPSPSSENNEDAESQTKKTNSPNSQNSENATAENSDLKTPTAQDRLNQEIVEMQKHQLLKEIVTQQQKLLQENRRLGGVTNDVITPTHPQVQLRHQQRRSEVLEKYNRQREIEEANATKSMALLNCRRYSAQLKVDQLAKEIAPKSGKKRRQDHQHFAALEAKLNEMKEKLQQVDKEIQNLQVNKQNALEKIRERQDLALLLSEQQDALAIIRRYDAESPNGRTLRRRERSSRKTLGSIEEQRSCSPSELRTSCSSDSLDSGRKIQHINYPQVFEDSGDEIPSSPMSSSTGCNHSLSSVSENNLTYVVNDPVASSVTSSIDSQDTLSKHVANKKSEIDPSVIAGIEDFEIFSKIMLKKLHKK